MYSWLPPIARSLFQIHPISIVLLLEVRNRVLRRGAVHALGYVPVLDDASAHESEDASNVALSKPNAETLEVDRSVVDLILVASDEDSLQVHVSANQHGSLSSDGDGGAVAGDLRGVVDEVLGDVGVVALSHVVLDVD